jgi:hypothetical protein
MRQSGSSKTMPIRLDFPNQRGERALVHHFCEEHRLSPPQYEFPAPLLLNELEKAADILQVLEKSEYYPDSIRRRCRYFVEEYLIPELETFMEFANQWARHTNGSCREVEVARTFGIEIRSGRIRRVSRTKAVGRSDQEFLNSMNIRW